MRLFVCYFSFFSTYNIYILLYIKVGDYMRKRFKRKNKLKLRIILYIFIFVLLFYILKFNIGRIKIINSNQGFINNILNDMKNTSVNQLLTNINKNIFNSPLVLLKNELKYRNNVNSQINLVYKENTLPLIYIYNSHQGEKYSYKYLEEYNIVPNVLMASHMLSEKLNNYGINTIVEENNILEYMDINNLDHSGSYIASRYFLENTMKKYNSIELYIDLHRDAISHKNSYISINGKDCAKILFVIGLEYDTYEENLKVVEKLNTIINNKYPNLSRGIMKKQGYGVNGVYNQDLNSNVILIEIGGHENNIDEVNNTLDLVADSIKEYLNEKK